jgi:hypothetical protein
LGIISGHHVPAIVLPVLSAIIGLLVDPMCSSASLAGSAWKNSAHSLIAPFVFPAAGHVIFRSTVLKITSLYPQFFVAEFPIFYI